MHPTCIQKMERILLPRSLVGRRDTFLEIFHSENPANFSVGDVLKFQKFTGQFHFATILGFRTDGNIDMMHYDGMPHHFLCSENDLYSLRIVEINTMSADDVQMYREWLGLDEILQ